MRKSYLFAGLSVLAALFACGDDEGGKDEGTSGSTVASTCSRVCQRSNAANCSGEVASDCVSDCVQFATQEVPRACASQLDSLFACSVKAKFVCDADDESLPTGCDSQANALAICIQQNQPSTPGGGNDAGTLPPPNNNNDAGTAKPDASTGTGGNDGGISGAFLCMPETSDDTCDSCGKSKCCAEYTACGADCQALSLCVSDCIDDSCVQTCLTTHQTGSDQLLAIADCFDNKCAAECDEEEQNELCLTSAVPPGYCNDPKRPLGLDCPAGPPAGDCVLSSTGAANVYCCAQ